MNIVVPIQFVPDLVEELIVDDDGKALDPYEIRWMLNEFDDNAIEQAILIKENDGSNVIVVAPDFEDADDVLAAAAAKGADRLIKLGGDFEESVNNHALARIFQPVIQGLQPDLILTGVQAHHNLDGALGPILAELLDTPYVGYVSGVTVEGEKVTVKKDYPGGLIGEIEVALPVVLGIQSAESPPRYVPISKVRQAMKSSSIDEEDSGDLDQSGSLAINKMYEAETGEQATMLEGDVDEIADRIVEILDEQGLL